MAKVLIVGGGLGGLAAAAALHRAGVEAHVYEQAKELREIGAGLSVWPNATRVLATLGLLDQALARSGEIRRLEVRDPFGRLLSAIAAPGQQTTPSLCMLRADLLALLASQVPSDRLHLGRCFEEIKEVRDRVIVRFPGGEEAEGDVLVGADGLFSSVRSVLFGESRPIYRGCHAWRGLADVQHDLGATAIEFWGAGRRVGLEPLSPTRVFWYATENAPRDALGQPLAWRGRLTNLFGGWDARIRNAITATPQQSLFCHDLCDRPPRARWGRGRITLLGDAAHPTTPYLGQGACMALEDALVLAQCIVKYGTSPKALRHYKCARVLRTSLVTLQSREIGWLGQWERPMAVAFRNALIRMTPDALYEWPHRRLFSSAVG